MKRPSVFYHVSFTNITKYEYLCEYPMKSESMRGKYHILINRKTEEPVRVYHEQLDKMIGDSVPTYDQARQVVIENLKSRIERMENDG